LQDAYVPRAQTRQRNLPNRQNRWRLTRRRLWARSFLRHAEFAQASEINAFVECAELRWPPIASNLHVGDRRHAGVTAQPLGYGKHWHPAFGLAIECIGATEERMDRGKV